MKPSPETVELVEKSLDQSILPDELVRLEELLAANPADLDYYLEAMQAEAEIPLALHTLPERRQQRAWVWPTSIAAAAAIAMLIGINIGTPSGKTALAQESTSASKENAGATITSLVGVTWENKAPSGLKLTSSDEGFSITSGLVELTFDSGVRTLIEGPAEIAVTGRNSAEFTNGKLVADVPKGAEGFTIVYPEGKVVDLGTEFAININEEKASAEVGVFRGEVEVYSNQSKSPLKILESHAVKQTLSNSTPFASIPFNQDDYIRKVPSSEFSWKLDEKSTEPVQQLEFDVSHLVWKPGKYRATFKYMLGYDALSIQEVTLLCDGEIVASDEHPGRTGIFLRTHDNMYTLDIARNDHRKGKWVLKATVHADTTDREALSVLAPDSSGIMLFSENIVSKDAYLGTWEYRHDNNVHRRVFLADHTAKYYFNGTPSKQFNGATWSVKDGVLVLTNHVKTHEGTHLMEESHILNDKGQLVIINQPYRNAIKVKRGKQE